ncbi:unnamed protein product [Urochloa decumbens]|uniref:Uncharacterized protein n=1 Tax=Urochloa decumbens TaxID=240449 RepID=A0ABC9E656_9POAL
MAERVRVAIVLGVGGAAVGGPEALRLMMGVSGRSAAADVAVCVFLVCAFTALVLGNLLLILFFRDARRRNAGAAAPAPALATERFPKVTAATALAAMLFVTASLLLIVGPAVPAGCGNAVGGAARSCSASA